MANLPSASTRFIGREAELLRLRERLASARVLTLTGPGGCGKTRLALELAQAAEFADGAAWCDLVSISDAGYLPQRLLDELGLREQTGRPPLETVIAALSSQHKLLVLDNCEHVLAAAAAAVQAILRACASVTVLATSLQALGLPEEVVWPVAPLAMPNMTDEAEALSQTDSVQLFVERAQQALPAFSLTAQNAASVAAICRRVDGLPLALELAAARLRMLSPTQLAERLADAIPLLTRGAADDPRHTTLHATLEWSWGLLSAAEQAVLRRLAVFAGTFSLEAAEAVCADELTPAPVLDLLTDLAEKSLVAVVTRDAEGEARYRLLEVVRQYARAKLEQAGETSTIRGRHLEWCAARAMQAAPQLAGPEQVAWLNRLEIDHDNFRAALGWVRLSRQTERGLQLAWALWRFWLARNHLTEGRAWLEELLALDAEARSAPVTLRARAMYAAAALAFRQSDRTRAQTLAEAGLPLAREAGDTQNAGGCLNLLAILATERGELERATALHAEALTIHRAAKNPAGISTALLNLGMIARQQGDFARTAGLYEEALTLKRQIGERLQVALILNSLGEIAIFRGDDQTATVRLEESLALFRELGYKPGLGQALNNLAVVARNRGDVKRVQTLMEEALAVLAEAGDPARVAVGRLNLGDLARDGGDRTQAQAIYSEVLTQCRASNDEAGVALALYLLGLVATEADDRARAQALLAESLSLHRKLGARLGMTESLEALALAQLAPEEARRGARWLGAVAAQREVMGGPVLAAERGRVQRGLDALRAVVGQSAFNTLWAEGRALTLDQVIAEALTPATVVAPVITSSPITLRVFSLGPAQVIGVDRAGERAVTEWTYAKARELLYFLLSHPPQTKAQIGLALWPEASSAQLRNIFHRALHSLRAALGKSDWVTFADEAYSINRAPRVEFDAALFDAEVKAARRAPANTSEQRQSVAAQLEAAVARYHGDFLNDLDVGEWALARREELRRLNLEALLLLGRLRFAEAQYAQAAAAYQRVLSFDSYLELAHRELMRCLARQGEMGQALRQYQTLRQLLLDDLGAPPAAETTFLFERLKRGDDV